MREPQNSTERIVVTALDSSSAGVTGATITLTIRRNADGYYWDGAAFGASFSSVSMTETDATNMAGYYHYDFNTNGLADAVYTVRATTLTAGVVNGPWTGEIRIGGWVDDVVLGRKYLKNKLTISGSTYTLYDDDGTTILETGTTSTTNRTPA